MTCICQPYVYKYYWGEPERAWASPTVMRWMHLVSVYMCHTLYVVPEEQCPCIQRWLTTSPFARFTLSSCRVTFKCNHSVKRNAIVQLACIPRSILPLPNISTRPMTKMNGYAGVENTIGPAVQQKLMNKEQNDCTCDDNKTGLGALPCAAQTETLHYNARVHSSGRVPTAGKTGCRSCWGNSIQITGWQREA